MRNGPGDCFFDLCFWKEGEFDGSEEDEVCEGEGNCLPEGFDYLSWQRHVELGTRVEHGTIPSSRQVANMLVGMVAYQSIPWTE